MLVIQSRERLLCMLDRMTWHHARAAILTGNTQSVEAIAIYETAAHNLLQGQKRKFASCCVV
jgi:hypothetical protein